MPDHLHPPATDTRRLPPREITSAALLRGKADLLTVCIEDVGLKADEQYVFRVTGDVLQVRSPSRMIQIGPFPAADLQDLSRAQIILLADIDNSSDAIPPLLRATRYVSSSKERKPHG